MLLLQIAAEKMEELESRELKLANEIQQLNEQMSRLHEQHAGELDRLSGENAAELQRLRDELSRQKESAEDSSGKGSELVYYQRHLEAMEQIDELRDLVAERQSDIESLQESLGQRDAELEQLKANISSRDTDDGGLIAAIQLDLEHVTAER